MLRGISAREIHDRLTGLARNIYDAMVVQAAREMLDTAPDATFDCILLDKNAEPHSVAFTIAGIYVTIRVGRFAGKVK